MTANLLRTIAGFGEVEVLVIGEAMLDRYLEGQSGRLAQEAPVPIVGVASTEEIPGGAANVAVNAAALGAKVRFVSVLGDDAEGDLVAEGLRRCGIETSLVAEPGRRTLCKSRVVADSQLLVRFDQGDTGPVEGPLEREVVDSITRHAPDADVVIVSDYGYGVLTPGVVEALGAIQARHPRLLVVDAKDLAAYRGAGVTVAKPNYGQAARLLGETEVLGERARTEQMTAASPRLLELTGAQIVTVTLDADGALVFEREREPYRTYARSTRLARAAGAGDTFVAGFALALAAGADTPSAAELASAAAAAVVAKEGTATCTAEELREGLGSTAKYLPDTPSLLDRLEAHRRLGRRVVFTNGCFDLLHRGHVSYLSRAKMLGDVLVVGVNSDRGVRRLKGPRRPITPLEDRVEVLGGLSSVDHVVAFDEDTPVRLIRDIRPDVFVKGGDYTREMLPEAAVVEELGGAVRILPYVEDRSTTGIVERIRRAEAEASAAARDAAPTDG
jgi:D-beta-D-heptose 7-phosphate kinase / D-beta-D-heptose 1-phosphate adenosyltransferase